LCGEDRSLGLIISAAETSSPGDKVFRSVLNHCELKDVKIARRCAR
jgi:hypothetical protein